MAVWTRDAYNNGLGIANRQAKELGVASPKSLQSLLTAQIKSGSYAALPELLQAR